MAVVSVAVMISKNLAISTLGNGNVWVVVVVLIVVAVGHLLSTT